MMFLGVPSLTFYPSVHTGRGIGIDPNVHSAYGYGSLLKIAVKKDR